MYTSTELNFKSEKMKIDGSKGEHKNWISKKMKKKMELSNALRLAEIYMYVVVVLKQ